MAATSPATTSQYLLPKPSRASGLTGGRELDLFTEHGFADTITAIAERAGVSPQTIYATFGSKGAILQALLAQMEDDAGAPAWRDRIATADDPAAKLEGFAHWSAAMFSTSKNDHPCISRYTARRAW